MTLWGITLVFPFMLLFLGGVILLFMYFLLKKKKKGLYLSSFEDIVKVYGGNSPYYYITYGLFFLASIIFILLFANPKEFSVLETVKKNGVDVVLVLDLSYSMQAQDISPNRLEVAKKVSSDFVAKLQTDRVGLVLFAGIPFISVPLNFDYLFVQQYLLNIHKDTIEQSREYMGGTALGDALLLAIKALDLEASPEREKVIILITDGAATQGADPLVVLKYVKEKKIKVYTIGIGGDKETYITLFSTFGTPQKTAIEPVDEETLKKIAGETQGKYFRVKDENTFTKVFEEIQKLEKKEIVVESQTVEKQRYWLLTLLLCGIYAILFWLLAIKSIRL